ncbi:sigma-70 family RNA polymerase sigma factor [bacterium]|nr:sigma-70 family RNA polymerase sigma factor [bacterium]
MSNRKKEKIILLRIKAGQKDAFVDLYDLYSKAIYRYVYFKVPTKETAEDITSDVFMKSWEYINKHNNSIKNFQAFVYQVARNLIADFYKKNREMPLNDYENTRIIEDHSLTEKIENISDWQILDTYLRKLGKINGKWQEVVILKHIEGFSTKEIAKIVNESHSNTRVLIHRAMEKLKELAED